MYRKPSVPIVVIWLLIVSGTCLNVAFPAEPPGYYNSASGLSGPALRQALHLIIRNHNIIPYSSGSRIDTRDALEVLDQDPTNSTRVVLIYARRSEPKSTFGLTTGWNREHLWPNSYGIDDREPLYSDLHNLRAADANVNSARGNKFFDDSQASDGNYQKPAHVEAQLCSTDANSWEPPAAVKGDIARAMFYMDVRYAGGQVNETNLVLTDQLGTINSSATRMGGLATLLLWHRNDPVDDAERFRNDQIYSLYQTNRNPFVDHPEFVSLVYEETSLQAWLTVEIQGSNLQLRWPTSLTNARLETSTNLTTWSTVTNSPGIIGTNFVLSTPLTSSQQLYRLRLPSSE